MEFKRLLRSSGLDLKPVEMSYLRQKCGDASGQVGRPPHHRKRFYTRLEPNTAILKPILGFALASGCRLRSPGASYEVCQ